MSERKNLNHDGNELTIWYHEADGESRTCHYCKNDGRRQNIHVDEIDKDSVSLDINNLLRAEATKTFQNAMLHGRGLCELGGVCEDRFRADQDKSFSSKYG